MFLQQQYREKGFKKYSELISCLLVAEQNNELLMKNHEARPVGVAPFPEVNASQHNHFGKARGHGRGNVHGHGHAHNLNGNFKNSSFHQKLKNYNDKGKGGQSSKSNENICYRYGGKYIGDFFEDQNGIIDHLIGDGIVK
ncbi:zinc knuckle protein, putative [Medicago truncatula]|uniref:Zinc knuckle protein, putative n=1 Tax=Medicago truncatula TaxID=3880 RepID=A0A072UJ83_MEDTR|nr:zinc knuckle protein, putative [Medicago truncatula]